ncbi:deoxyribodipyrimidine photo-lyase [Sulfolobus acidocaldarius SUSAZ]|nr:deoxyribodipyrimidine photo-lyase [Sulfolobus acidocaldarius SUSAZ]
MDCAVIFRRDLRLFDNTALVNAVYHCNKIYPIFIVDPRQMINNPYKSEFAATFLINSLVELDKEVNGNLNVYYGYPENIVSKLDMVNAVFINEDYTPFAIQRDEKMKENALDKGIKFFSYPDVLLSAEEKKIKIGRSFTPFYTKVRELEVPKPQSVDKSINVERISNSLSTDFLLTFKKVESPLLKGGRPEGLMLLDREIDYSRKDYPAEKNYSMLSPHLKFGTVSPREVYHKKISDQAFTRQLYWRDFYTLLAYQNPYVFGHSFKTEYDKIKWENSEQYFNAWKNGMTGYPIIDAGMRALNTTGFINGRVRMLVAFFLTKVLFVDWRLGERYFATKLVDYDPAVNNGNWQWVASTGTDYIFRVFDPWKQQEKYDPEAKFIKDYVKELRDYPPSVIHKVYLHKITGYPSPILNWRERVEMVKQTYFSTKA